MGFSLSVFFFALLSSLHQAKVLLCFVLLFAPLPAPCHPPPPIPHSSNLENGPVVLEAVIPKLSLGAVSFETRPKLSCSRFRRVSLLLSVSRSAHGQELEPFC